VRRFALALVVALLAFGVSGASSLILSEPCNDFGQEAGEDGDCPPTCVTCGCCAQAAKPALHMAIVTPEVPVVQIVALAPPLPEFEPRDILHVPKSSR